MFTPLKVEDVKIGMKVSYVRSIPHMRTILAVYRQDEFISMYESLNSEGLLEENMLTNRDDRQIFVFVEDNSVNENLLFSPNDVDDNNLIHKIDRNELFRFLKHTNVIFPFFTSELANLVKSTSFTDEECDILSSYIDKMTYSESMIFHRWAWTVELLTGTSNVSKLFQAFIMKNARWSLHESRNEHLCQHCDAPIGFNKKFDRRK